MRKLIVVIGLAISCGTLFAQHGGHGGGFSSGHSFSSGGHFSSGAHFSGTADRPSAPRSFAAPTRSYDRPWSGANRTGAAGYNTRRTNRGPRVGYFYNGRAGYRYGYPGNGYLLNSGSYFGDNSDSSYDGSGGYAGDQQQAYAPYDNGPYDEDPYGEGQADPGQDFARPPYNGAASGDGSPQPNFALIFKDGHTLAIQNYVATRTRILVGDNGVQREIPLSALNIPATVAANQAAGVDFSLPASPLVSQ